MQGTWWSGAWQLGCAALVPGCIMRLQVAGVPPPADSARPLTPLASCPPLPPFRSCYYTRLKLKSQIIMFNHLLEQQVAMVQKVQRGWDGGAAEHFASVPQFASTTAGGIPLFHTSGSAGGPPPPGAAQAPGPAANGGAEGMAEGAGATGGGGAADPQHQAQQGRQQLAGQPPEGAAEAGGPLHAQNGAAAATSGSHGDFPFPADLAGHDHSAHAPSPLLRVGSGKPGWALSNSAGTSLAAPPMAGTAALLPPPVCPRVWPCRYTRLAHPLGPPPLTSLPSRPRPS